MSDDAIRKTDEKQDQRDSSLALSNASRAAQEIARLQDRLTYYESFDRLIQENIARSGELMREALDLRERTQAELARERLELERSRRESEQRMEAERASHRALLSGLVDELSTVRESAERLTRRVTEAVGTIGAEVPQLGSGTETPRLEPGERRGTPGRSATEPPRPVSEAEAIAETQDEPTDSEAFAVPAGERIDQGDASVTEEESVIALPAAEATGSGEVDVAPPVGSGSREAAGGGGSGKSATPSSWSGVATDSPVMSRADDADAGSPVEEVPAGFSSSAVEPGEEAANAETRAAAEPGPLGRASRQYDDLLTELSPDETSADETAVNVEAISPSSDAGVGDQAGSPGWDADAGSAEPEEARAITVLVHGVPRAATALSLQRHLAGLDHISGVEAREYAEGVLRLQVTSRRPLQFEDLENWEDGRGIQPVHLHGDVIEVRLPGADF